ncbi:unnamed protein product [Clavelina lepadiformis]|uniref:long-chain-fatty-acid--CoA ligase n=1 Tax=Clavelina lepadiformis TaxID=159417 RepID=A0ABP0GFB1_CLALP
MDLWHAVAAVAAGLLVLWQLVKVLFPWLMEDFGYIGKLAKAGFDIAPSLRNSLTLSDKLKEIANRIPTHPAIYFEDDTWTYQELYEWTNRSTRALKKLGLIPGDKLALMMMSEPAYLPIWMGCSNLGVVTSLLNYNLQSKSLLHCIDISEIKVLVIGKEKKIVEAVRNVSKDLKDRGISVYVNGSSFPDFKSLPNLIEQESSEPCPREWRGKCSNEKPIAYIFTSGTTGLPKAVKLDNAIFWKRTGILNILSPTRNDVVYIPLPLYHAAALTVGFSALISGCTVALRKKFSASQMWPDCRKYGVTIVLYIGETLRYVCMQPATEEDRNHKVRVVLGNGLRKDVWKTFLDRFGPHIHVCEYYGATEGNAGFINLNNKFGCVGTLSPLMKILTGSVIVKYHHGEDEICYDKNNKPILADYGEPGLLVMKITSLAKICEYKGNKNLTERKILRNVFKNGDQYFNSGDLMMVDKEYRLYFCDRVGDTFRWKGENVSTTEVADTIVMAPCIKEANVYGVKIPGNDGKAGMVSIVLESDKFDTKILYNHVCSSLPSYAQPLFVRVQPQIELTGTYKHRKVNLQQEGYDLENIGEDKVYFLDHQVKSYVRFTKTLQKKVENCELRL